MVDTNKRRQMILRHIKHVQDLGLLLAEKLIEKGEEELGLELIMNVLQHDASKFLPVEFNYLNDESKKTTPPIFMR